jgi:flagellar assembly factor FliW
MISVAPDELPLRTESLRTIESLILGDLEISDDVVMHFHTPLWGFPDHHDYALLPAARNGLWWLQSVTGAGITFLLADPFVLDAQYVVDLGETERQSLAIDEPTDALSFVMLTLPVAEAEAPTANFRAPLVFNITRRVGQQVVSRDEAHELRRQVSLDVFPAQDVGVRMR